MSNAVDEALELGVIARKLFMALRYQECLCVETDEYKEWQATKEWFLKSNYPDADEETLGAHRLIYILFGNPYEGEQVSETCQRCSAMEAYENFIGQDHLNLYLEGRE
jgi:hypothetical protein